jgi:SAM-dependent methyltransferase
MPVPMLLPARDRRPERMDDPALDPAAHRSALAGLARINRFSGSAAVLWPELAKLARTQGRPVRVLDVATGAGDVPVALARRAAAAGLNLRFAGCDVSDTAVTHARRAAEAAGVGVEFFRHDALAEPLPRGFDAVTCSLFLHHLDEADATKLLAAMAAAAGRLVLVNDLRRGPVNLALVWLAARLLSRSPVVHEDGPLSVRAAFTLGEVGALADRAGLTGAAVGGRFPCRFLMTWGRP